MVLSMSSLKSLFGDFFELPKEVVLDSPLIMLVGKEKLFLENHKGIALYQKDTINIRLNTGFLKVKGNKLEIEEIETDKIYVIGNISGLEYCKD